MARKFNTNGIADGTLPGTKIASGSLSAASVSSVRISSIIITDNSYVLLDDSAVILTGGYIKLFGIGFVNGCSVAIDTTIATSVSFVSSTELNVQVPAKAAGTYNLYLTTPTGAVAIRVNAITYSSTPTWSSTSPLPGGVNNTAISIQLGATSDSTVSYTVQAGSTLPTGLTLSSGGLLSGTVTGLVLETTYNFTVVATDVELQDSPKAFSITIVVSDPYFKNTVLLLQGDATPFISDASTNKFEISAVGTPSANVNNPLQPGYYSGYFNGSTYVSAPDNAAFIFGTGNFTIECWINTSSTTGTYGKRVVEHYTYIDPTNYGWILGVLRTAGTTINFEGYTNGTLGITLGTSNTLAANVWHHIVVVRSGSNASLYLDGTRVATQSGVTWNDTNTIPAGLEIGSQANLTGTIYDGYISNLRIVKGTAVYDPTLTTITVPTSPLTAITNTSLLALQSNRFIDNSSTPNTITAYGTTSISVTQPFTLPSPYTGYGAGLFNGTTDYLTVPNNASLNMGASDFTYECWLYPTSIPNTYQTFIEKRTSGSYAGVLLAIKSNGKYSILVADSTPSWGIVDDTTINVVLNTWQHIAVVRSGNTFSVYLNGLRLINTSMTFTVYDQTVVQGIGAGDSSGGQPYFGYISDVRIVKGTAVYTSNFTPPTSPLTAIANTSLLALQNNQAQNNNQFRDSSTNNFAVTRTGTPTQGTFTPFSQTGWSVYLPPQQYVTTPANSTFDITAVDFTVEFWVYFTAYNTMGSSGMTVIGNLQSSTGWLCGLNGIGGLTGLSFNTYSAGALVSNLNATGITSTNLPLNSWHHIAFVRSGSNFYFFLDGVSYNATSAPTAVGAGGRLAIGVYQQNLDYSGNASWYVSNVRIVKGVAVYTGNFTPPTAPLTATQSGIGNIAAITGTATSLLTFNRNRFIDTIATPNIFTTPGSLTSIQSFSPFAPAAAYSATTVGGSMYFNGGQTNYLQVSTPAMAGNFTIECWVYLTQFSTNQVIMGNTWEFWVNTSGQLIYYVPVGYAINATSLTIGTNSWNHIALVRSGSVTRFYINGVADSVTYNTLSTLGPESTYIARDPGVSGGFTGYISNVRIVNGTALYTATFTPPTAPLTAIANTVLLLNATNSGIFDATGKNDLVTVGDARVSTSVTKYGTGAMYFDGTGDYVTEPTNVNFGYGTGDFTIEFWLYLNALGIQTIFSNLSADASLNPHIYYNSGLLYFTNSATRITGSTLSTATWYHIAVCRASSSTKMFINGTQSGSTYADTNNYGTTAPLGIGTYWVSGTPSSASTLNGYIDDLRVTKGIARYTTTFTPPSQAMLGM